MAIHATAQILNCLIAVKRLVAFRQRQLRWEHVRLLPTTTNTALELVAPSCGSQALRILNNQRVSMRIINAGLTMVVGHHHVNLRAPGRRA